MSIMSMRMYRCKQDGRIVRAFTQENGHYMDVYCYATKRNTSVRVTQFEKRYELLPPGSATQQMSDESRGYPEGEK